MNRGAAIVLALCAVLVLTTAALISVTVSAGVTRSDSGSSAADASQGLFKEIQPVKLSNCELQRFGEKNDGGYLLCGNLLGDVRAAYSYGISGYDGWGCDVSRRLDVYVHQYDCFDLSQPLCATGKTIFHGECIGSSAGTRDGRPFDTLAGHIARNGDRGKQLVIKMDVEGAEWDTLLTAPIDVLRRIDQLAIEFHGFDEQRFRRAVRRLKILFHIAHLHWNNYSCVGDGGQFPAWAYEVLLVNKRIGRLDPAGRAMLPHALDAPNAPDRTDCQVASQQ